MNRDIERLVELAGSQQEAARRVGVHFSTVSRWLGGMRTPHPALRRVIRDEIQAIEKNARRRKHRA